MNELAIRTEGLGKLYHIGARQIRGYSMLRESLVNGLTAPFRRAANLIRGKATGAAELHETIWALKDVSLEVRRGEVVGIIGRNGAGKSTLLKILSRITEPTEGVAEIFGRVGSLLEVGTGFHPELTGRENIYLNGAVLGMSRTEIARKFDSIVDFAEIERFIDTPVKHYSSGMYVRLAFAVAAHLEPEILVVDEVLSVGDAAFQRKCLGKMGEVAHGGRTVLFVSHNMAMVKSLCDRAILLDDGRITMEGEPAETIERYLADVSDSSRVPLADRRDRKGAGEILITAIEVLDGGGRGLAMPMSGQTVTFRVHYSARVDRIFRNCRVGLDVKKDERIFFLLSTELVGRRTLELKGDGYVDFTVPELPLSAGGYLLTSFVESNRIVQDWVEAASQMNVIDGDFYGTGRNYPKGNRGEYVLVRYTWSHARASEGQPVRAH